MITRLWSEANGDWQVYDLAPPVSGPRPFPQGNLGVIAEIKAGKGTIADIIAKAVARHGGVTQLINYSDNMGAGLRAGFPHIKPDRDAYQKIAVSGRNAFGPDVWAQGVDYCARKSTADFVVLAGMRWPPELPLVKALPNNHVVYLTAPAHKRLEWLRAKAERPGDAEKTQEQFDLEEVAETERYIKQIGTQADSHIDNSGTFEELVERVHLLLRDRFGIK